MERSAPLFNEHVDEILSKYAGRTPDEIAISIVSEMLLFRVGGDGSPMKLDESYYHQLTKNQV